MLDKSLFNTEEILGLLKLEQIGEDRYRGQSHFMGSPNVFGGQVVAQSLHAAYMTVPERRVHSLHSMFLLPGNHRMPIEYDVERVRDGGSFTTRRVVAYQEGRRIFVMAASFQTVEEGLSHQRPAPDVPDPETLSSSIEATWKKLNASGKRPFNPVPVDFRAVRDGDLLGGGKGHPEKMVWTRTPLALPDDTLAHETLFAYVSDYGFLSTSLQPHNIVLGDPKLQIASLDHTIWFHRPFRMDEWLLFEMESPNASGGRGLCFAYVYNQKRELIATMAQEGLIRVREKSA